MSNCREDAQTYCPSLIPTPEEFDAMTDSERRQRGGEIISCLQDYQAALSEACQQTLEHLPPPPSGGTNVNVSGNVNVSVGS